MADFTVTNWPDEFTIVDNDDNDWVIYTRSETNFTLHFEAVGLNDAAIAVAAAAAAAASAASIMDMIPPGGTTGQALVKASDSDYDFTWGAGGGGSGDMLASVYDPTNVADDAFARANHTGSQLAATISDFSTAADARVSAAIGVTVQAYNAQLAQIAALAAPGADRLLFWDHSALAWTFLTLGTNLSITGTTLNASVSGGGGGDMLASMYDPTNVQDDAFARANHTGTQLAATISDFSTAADARVSAAIGVTVQAYSANTAFRNTAQTFTGLQTFDGGNVAYAEPVLVKSSHDSDGGALIVVEHERPGGNEADDYPAGIILRGRSSAGNPVDFVGEYANVLDPTDGAENSAKDTWVKSGGADTLVWRVGALGGKIGSPSGGTDGQMGAGTLNVEDEIYIDGVPLSDSMKFLVFPEDYGAVGDGTTDDQAALNAALAAVIAAGGGCIQLKAKRYRLSASLAGDIATTHVALVGLGRDVSELVFDSNVDGLVITIDGDDWENGGHFRWDHLTLSTLGDLNATAAQFIGQRDAGDSTNMVSSIGIKMRGVDTTANGWEHGAVHTDCQGVNYYRPEFMGRRGTYSANAFAFTGPNSGTEVGLTNPVAYWCNGVDIQGTVEGVCITDPQFVAVGYGVYHHTTAQEPQFQVKGGHINANIAGVYSTTGIQCAVENCLIYEWGAGGGSRWDGIRFVNGYSNVIAGNQIHGWNTSATTRRGISLETCTRTSVYGNIINGFTSSFKLTHGIYDDGAARSTVIYGNSFDDDTVAVRSNVGAYFREKLRANLSLYVRTDGSDANDGLANSAARAYLTPQAALNFVLNHIDLAGFNATINIVAGTYAGGLTMSGAQVGFGNITINGDTTTPSNCTIGAVLVDAAGARLFLQGLNINKGTGTYCIKAMSGGYIRTTGLNRFTSTSGGHRINADGGGKIDAWANEEIAGAVGGAHYLASNNGILDMASTVGGADWVGISTPTQAIFAWAFTGGRIYAFNNAVLSGTISSTRRFSVESGGSIVTNGGGLSYFPGTLAGVARGGWYDSWTGKTVPTAKSADFTVAEADDYIYNTKAGSALVVTLPAASDYNGREITFKNTVAFAINSASSNVVPMAGGAAGTVITANVAGRWVKLVSDGTNWVAMEGVP